MSIDLSRLVSKLFRAKSHLIFEADCSQFPYPNPRDGEQFLVIDDKNIESHRDICAALLKIDRDAQDYLKDVKRGKVAAFIILNEGEIVHCSYVFFENKTACILGLPGTSALIGNAFTVPSYRGRGCQPRSVAARASIARAENFARVVAETSPDNARSQSGLRKAGMRLAGRMDMFVILNVLVIRWRRPSDYPLFGFCIRARRRAAATASASP
ncbi:GNAT family N-acetyltransferase [Sphingosinicella microcystinivorans]|uniref:GNAT family N-acetyltransferase n=1 Tax=Sphingosinicella microcystinivorans TaxID=335406 RepID=UPI0022F3DA10|nr:hypothetical protein [Sphingosinicella microcystinivorans]WBX86007.1 hypothetical protein PE061_08890 [Sphingosinicella microcystinivorans]